MESIVDAAGRGDRRALKHLRRLVEGIENRGCVVIFPRLVLEVGPIIGTLRVEIEAVRPWQ